jgi:hypothetical protein
VALFCVGALAVETANHTGVLANLLYRSPAAAAVAKSAGPAASATPARAASETGFQNRAAPADEPVRAWKQGKSLCSYDLALVLHPDEKRMTGTLRFTYVNTETEPMGELHFLLYANSYGKLQYGIFELDDLASAYPNGFSPGSIGVSSVLCEGGGADYYVEGLQNQVLCVILPKTVPPGGTTDLTIAYEVSVPNCYGRFGYGDDTMSLVNCNPILSVYDGGKWFDYPYYAIGDPFYSETADYEATITAPAGWTVAATGVLTEARQGGGSVWSVDAPGRRDFGFVASDRFRVMQEDVDGVLVRSYYFDGDEAGGSEALETAAQAMRLYGETFGPYPYGEYSVVETDFFIGGMEYPGMALIDDSLYSANSAVDSMLFDIVVAHETSHMWWYSTVGDNEVVEPWIDEGLAEFSTQYFFERRRSKAENDFYRQYNDYYKNLRKAQEGDFASTLPVYSFDGNNSYSAWVYARTAEVLQDLRKSMGDEKFFSALRAYYADHRLGITTRKDLEKAFEDASGRDLTLWFEREFNKS